MESVFSAIKPSLGYLYQVRYGLMLIVSEENEDAKLLIEQIDDISIETPDNLNVYQTKLHIKSKANLTDASSDLWKTLRVWCEGIKSGQLNPENCLFNLITTEIASKDTLPYKLKQDASEERDIDEIQKLLLIEAAKTSNAKNKDAYTSFLSLTGDQQKSLIEKTTIIDASIDLNKAKAKIYHELRNSTLKVEPLYERLEGWFIGQVILQLQGLRNEISAKEVRVKIIDVSDRLKEDNLPNDFNTPIIKDDDQLAPYKNQKFVRQMKLIGANQPLINHAISDYHRAFSQKSKWMREGLIDALDEIEYDKQLAEDWDRKFSIISDCKTTDNEETQKQKGNAFYVSHYVEKYPQIHIKERFKEQYMVTGSCQMLSDKKKIGWHPDFVNKIK